MADDMIVVLRKRPLSIWVLCIVNGLLAMFLIGASIKAEDLGYSGGQAAIAGLTGLGISIAAHATWFGKRTGRLVMLVLLTVFLGLLLVQSVRVIVWAAETGYRADFVDAAYIRAGVSLIWLALNYFVLFGRKAKAFFG
jgi:hypothetical protein